MSDRAPAGELPALPTTFRPRRARQTLAVLAVVVVISLVTLAIVLPAPGRTTEGFNRDDRIGFVVLAGILAGGLGLLARPRVRADERGLEVINVMHRHRLDWAQVVAVRMRPGDAWMVLGLDDGAGLNAMGVQAADGAYGRAQGGTIAALVAAHSQTVGDD